MTQTITVFQLAQSMGKTPEEMIFELQSLGIQVKSANDALGPEVVQRLLSGNFDTPKEVIVRTDKSQKSKEKPRVTKKPPKTKVPVAKSKAIPVIQIPKKKTSEAETTPVEKPKKRKPEKAKKPEPKIKKPKTKPSAKPKEAKSPQKPSLPKKKVETLKAPIPEIPSPKKKKAKPIAEKPVKEITPPEPPVPKEKEKKSFTRMEAKEPKKTPKKSKKAVLMPEEEMASVDIRKFIGSTAQTLQELEALEEKASKVKKKKKKKKEQEKITHVPLTLAEQVKALRAKIPKETTITLTEGATLRDLVDTLGFKVKEFAPYLLDKQLPITMNQSLPEELLDMMAEDLGFTYEIIPFEEKVAQEVKKIQTQEGVRRPPIVTIMGHVDHGKTSLLDYIRKTRIAKQEAGGITQHIGASEISYKGKTIVFIDTPGHEAFTQMRARGAQVTDLVVLTIAADDGMMPQTIEAINHAKAAGVPIMVAITKIDKANAKVDRVKQQLAERNLMPEDWGGDTLVVPTSVVTGEGIDKLLEMILLLADLYEWKADPSGEATGVVLEAKKEVGRGIVATVIIQKGTLKKRDAFICGNTYGRVRAMFDSIGKPVTKAPPSKPVEIIGFADVPNAGDIFQVVRDEKEAMKIVEHRLEKEKGTSIRKERVSLEELFAHITGEEKKKLPLILKADVLGSLEVLSQTLEKQFSEEVDLQILHEGLGAITTNDVALAEASRAIVIGFHVRPERKAVQAAEKAGVDIRCYTVIYELLEDLEKALKGMLAPVMEEVIFGHAEVLQTFTVPKVGTVAGCQVQDGIIKRGASIRVIRDGTLITTTRISSLKRFKKDVQEVHKGYECGIALDRFQDIKIGDILECFGEKEVPQE